MRPEENLSRKLAPFTLTALRVGSGMIFIAHGWQKLVGYDAWLANVRSMDLPGVLAGMAVAAELGGGIALLLGVLTPLSCLALLAVMVVAIWKVHLTHGLMASAGGFEYPLTLGLVMLHFMVRGPGPISFDYAVFQSSDDAARDLGLGVGGEKPPGTSVSKPSALSTEETTKAA